MPETETTKIPITREEVSVGDAAPKLVSEPLTRQDFVKYAGASGDFTEIHYSDPYADDAGYDSVFAQGMFTAGFLGRMVTNWVGVAALDSFRIRFVDLVWPGAVVAAGGEVSAIDRETGEMDGDVWVENQDGDRVVEGSITATLPTRYQ